MSQSLSPYDRHLARQRRASKAYRDRRRHSRMPDARDVGAVLLALYVDRRVDREGGDGGLVEALIARGFNRDVCREVLQAAVERARQARTRAPA